MNALVLPSRREEAWRWSDLTALADARVMDPVEIARPAPWTENEGPKLVFVDGRYDPEQSDPRGFALAPVEMQSDHALGRYATGQGHELRFAADTMAALQILHISTGGEDQLQLNLVAERDAAVSIVETFIGAGWVNRLTRLDLARSARVMRAVRLLGERGFASLRDEAILAEGASLVSVTLAAGGMDSRIDGEFDLRGEGAYAEASGALLARARQRHDANFVLRHMVPSGTSRQIWRSVADDHATCSIAARVEVARDAQKTDGEQSLKGLLLARSAVINAKPELEIFADDVKCAHGASVGALDRNALFYLESRGVAPDEARALLTRAFVADALDRIGDEKVRAAFYADVETWFSQESFVPSEVEGRP